ncbi:MAG TPA: polymer-forming cytoskeletal protein [Bacillales bacterium]|nr:polymer-forming cytoskeletal protein [Bacillales bacterium]
MSNDLMINGVGRTAGGEFDKVTVNGRGTVDGNLDCQELECNGRGAMNGDIRAKRFEIHGNAVIKGNVDARELSISGNARIHGDTAVKDVQISGNGTIKGHFRGEKLKINGKLKVGEDCEAERFEADGQFKIGGLLNADEVEIRLYGESEVKEIGGQTVRIQQKIFGLIKILKTLFPVKLTVGTIEGDDVDLESTKAEVVRGNNVRIGPGCEIDLVEYHTELQQDKKAKVKEKRKL